MRADEGASVVGRADGRGRLPAHGAARGVDGKVEDGHEIQPQVWRGSRDLDQGSQTLTLSQNLGG